MIPAVLLQLLKQICGDIIDGAIGNFTNGIDLDLTRPGFKNIVPHTDFNEITVGQALV